MSPTVHTSVRTLYNLKMLKSTETFSEAKSWAEEILGSKNSAKYFMAQENFVAAYKDLESFSFFIQGEAIYGQLYGPNAYFDQRCQSIALADSAIEISENFKRGGSSQFWEAVTFDNGSKVELLQDATEINKIIDEHAPDSSVRPGDLEEIFWGGIRNEEGELASLAALVKWQSGLHVMVSVVTRIQDRGKGLATLLSAGMVSQSYVRGIREIGLGVQDGNISAIHVYQKLVLIS